MRNYSVGRTDEMEADFAEFDTEEDAVHFAMTTSADDEDHVYVVCCDLDEDFNHLVWRGMRFERQQDVAF